MTADARRNTAVMRATAFSPAVMGSGGTYRVPLAYGPQASSRVRG